MGNPSVYDMIWHRVTCHPPTQVNAPRRKHCQTGWYSIYLSRRDGRLSWCWCWLYTEMCAPQVLLRRVRLKVDLILQHAERGRLTSNSTQPVWTWHEDHQQRGMKLRVTSRGWRHSGLSLNPAFGGRMPIFSVAGPLHIVLNYFLLSPTSRRDPRIS